MRMPLFFSFLLAIAAMAACAGRVEASQSTSATDEADAQRVALVTFGPGENYWERFGHNALVVDDTTTGKRIAYNYGVFDFNESRFLLNFALGHMHYSLYAEPLDEDIDRYVGEGRSVTVQMLNLTPAQAHQLSAFLAWNVQPQYAVYQYDYFLNNCSTKLRDALNAALGGELARQLGNRPTPSSYRFDGVRLISPDFWFALAIDMGLGPKADARLSAWQQTFVPTALSDALDTIVVRGDTGTELPLVSQKQVIFAGSLPSPPTAPRDLRLTFSALGLALAALLLLLERATGRGPRAIFVVLTTTWWTICGIIGLVLIGLWAFSDHWAAWRNENLLLLDPVCLALPIVWWRSPRIASYLAALVAAIALAAVIVRMLPGVYQSNLAFIAFMLPIHLVLAVLAWGRRHGKEHATAEFLTL
jgi:Domain of unknown function (DUF4105)